MLEYVDGETLKELIRREGPLEIVQAVAYALEIARALGEAHGHQLVHRDVKPQNILISAEGAAKITDFGIARPLTEAALTMPGRVLATTDYIAPEQALGEPVSGRSDLYSLGIVLFEMLTGRLPFKGATSTALALQIVQAAPPAPSSVNTSVPRELDPIVTKALAKSFDQRYQSAATMAADLRAVSAILDMQARIEPPSATVTILPPRRSYRAMRSLYSLRRRLLSRGSRASRFERNGDGCSAGRRRR